MLTLLQNITQKLHNLQIPYMLTGSMAMGFYTIKIVWIQTLYSDRQIADIEKLLLNPAIDKEYLYYWLKALHLNTYQIEL
jgi:hypothetical protein